MSPDDVHGNEMDEPHDFDDDAADALIRGTGDEVDPRVAEIVGDMRAAYASTPPAVGAALAAMIGTPEPVVTLSARRFERMRSSIIAKVGAATAVVVAATGGLAVAGALPAPVQDAVSHIGVGGPAPSGGTQVKKTEVANDESTTTTSVGGPSTTMPESTTPTTTGEDNHGGEVSDVAHDHEAEGCEHADEVADVASDGKAEGQPCPTSTTVPGDNGQAGDGNHGDGSHNDGNHDGNGGTTPTTVEHSGGDQGSGSDSSHGSGSSGGDHSQGHGGDNHGSGGGN
jgi:uncharacterized membrane protein YgcG